MNFGPRHFGKICSAAACSPRDRCLQQAEGCDVATNFVGKCDVIKYLVV